MTLAPDYLERFTIRCLEDSLVSATRRYWLRRADELDACRVRPGDYMGNATPETVIARHDRLTLAAEQCRLHADLFDHDSVDAGLIAEILGWQLDDDRAVA